MVEEIFGKGNETCRKQLLMVFLISTDAEQRKRGHTTEAQRACRCVKGASNRLIDLEDWTEEELSNLHRDYRRLAELAREDKDTHRSPSVDDAESRHRFKQYGDHKPAA